MSQIFISHSKVDKELRRFFSDVFATTKVKAVFEEFELITRGKRNNLAVKKDIENSSALFVILSPNVVYLPHTRDWIVWETGVAKNKDIWVFEYYRDFGKISVVTPLLNHYLLFSMNRIWFRYVKRIIESYEKSKSFSKVIEEIDDDISAIAGNKVPSLENNIPLGKSIICPHCSNSYNVHIPPNILKIRCPVCNNALIKRK